MTPNKNKTGGSAALQDLGTLPGRLAVCVDRAGGKRALAAKAIISEAQLFRYLGGINDIPLEKVIGIAKAADVDAGWLATGVESKPTVRTRPEFRPALMQYCSRMLDEFLVEYQRPMAPRLKSQLLTLIYEALRHEETVLGREDFPNKFRMLEILTFFEPFKTEELLQTYHEVMTQLEYGTLDASQHQLLSVFCNMVAKGWEHYYDSYVGQVYFDRIGYELAEEAQAELHEWVGMALTASGKPDLRWLDLGCGNGRHLAFLHKFYPKLKLKGVELSKQGLELCRKLEGQGKLDEGTVMQGDAQAIPLPDGSVDVVFARHCLQFVPYLPGSGLGVEKVLEELSRLLPKGGIVILRSTAGDGRKYSTFRQMFNRKAMESMLLAYGFTLKDLQFNDRVSDNPGGQAQTYIPDLGEIATLVLVKA